MHRDQGDFVKVFCTQNYSSEPGVALPSGSCLLELRDYWNESHATMSPFTQSIRESPKALLAKILENVDMSKAIHRSGFLPNNDVPSFLGRLAKFERASAKIDHQVG